MLVGVQGIADTVLQQICVSAIIRWIEIKAAGYRKLQEFEGIGLLQLPTAFVPTASLEARRGRALWVGRDSKKGPA